MFNGLQSQTKLSPLATVALCLGVAFAFSLMMTGAGHMAQQQQRERLADFASGSTAGSGTVTRKYREVMNGNTQFYDLEVSFTAADGSSHKQSFRIPADMYGRYNVGNSVPVTYVKSKPYLFHIPGAEPNEGNVDILGRMEKWFFGASILLGIGFLVSLCIVLMSRGDRDDIVPQPTRPPAAHMSGHPRAGFGSRFGAGQARR